MARKKRVRKTTKKKSGTKKKRTREWSKVTFAQLDAWREARHIPKKKMAEMLGVTNSTYHNWARGIAVATPNTQERILRAISENGAAHAAGKVSATAPTTAPRSPGVGPEVMAATGQIVNSYLQTRPSGMTADKLVKLVRDVRQALIS